MPVNCLSASIESQTREAWLEFITRNGEALSVAPGVRASWRRCRDLYRVDPHFSGSPVVLEPEVLRFRCREHDALWAISDRWAELDSLLGEVRDICALADGEGYVLKIRGDSDVLAAAAQQNLLPGANWSERSIGTNGLGTALAEHRPLSIRGSEHYIESFHRWFCAAAPVFDSASRVPLFVFGVLGPREEFQTCAWIAARAAAAWLEEKLAWYREKERDRLLDVYLKNNLEGGRNGAMVIDRRGTVLKANATAQRMLGICDSHPACEPSAELGPLISGWLRAASEAVDPQSHSLYYPCADQTFTTVLSPVRFRAETIGAVAIVPCRQNHAPLAQARIDTAIHAGRRRPTRAAGTHYRLDDLLGTSVAIRETLRMAALTAESDLPVLITGESGTGKEIVAHSIHNASRRAGKPLIAVNCGAIPGELSEAEFFGYESGAFTGAKRGGNIGKFEQAEGGTIFLDEVSELSPRAQASLLRTLQDLEIVRLGSSVARHLDVRIIAASNRTLRQEVARGRFREDLFYRLNVLTIDVPPLRDRREDVRPLAETFLAAIEERWAMSFSAQAFAILEAYPWPGNVRELKSVVQRLAIVASSRIIGPNDLPAEILLGGRAQHNGSLADAFGHRAASGNDRERSIKVLGECSGNVTEAARRLGVSRMTVYRRIRNWRISLSPPERSVKLSD